MKETREVICSNCGDKSNVSKSWNCHKCRVWNKFDIIEEETPKKRGKNKWLS